MVSSGVTRGQRWAVARPPQKKKNSWGALASGRAPLLLRMPRSLSAAVRYLYCCIIAFVTTSQIAAAVAAAAANDAVIYDVQSIDGADVDRDTST